MDRRLIRVEMPPAQAGIAAALRRAFEEAPTSQGSCDRDFDELLRPPELIAGPATGLLAQDAVPPSASCSRLSSSTSPMIVCSAV